MAWREMRLWKPTRRHIGTRRVMRPGSGPPRHHLATNAKVVIVTHHVGVKVLRGLKSGDLSVRGSKRHEFLEGPPRMRQRVTSRWLAFSASVEEISNLISSSWPVAYVNFGADHFVIVLDPDLADQIETLRRLMLVKKRPRADVEGGSLCCKVRGDGLLICSLLRIQPTFSAFPGRGRKFFHSSRKGGRFIH